MRDKKHVLWDKMPRYAEMVSSEHVDVYLPPPELVLSAAACALVNTSSMKEITVGGSISITTTCLLATLPNLYNLPDDPLKKYIHKDRGKKDAQGAPASWGPEDVQVKSIGISTIVKTALALTYYVVRRPQQNPMSQITKRFNALHATLFPGTQAPTIDLDPALDFREAAIWISSQGLDVLILQSLQKRRIYQDQRQEHLYHNSSSLQLTLR